MSYWRIKHNYESGLWTKEMVHKAVEKNVITKEQYQLIVGEEYNSSSEPISGPIMDPVEEVEQPTVEEKESEDDHIESSTESDTEQQDAAEA